MSFEERSEGHFVFDTDDEKKAFYAGLKRGMEDVEDFAPVRSAKALERIAAAVEKYVNTFVIEKKTPK